MDNYSSTTISEKPTKIQKLNNSSKTKLNPNAPIFVPKLSCNSIDIFNEFDEFDDLYDVNTDSDIHIIYKNGLYWFQSKPYKSFECALKAKDIDDELQVEIEQLMKDIEMS